MMAWLFKRREKKQKQELRDILERREKPRAKARREAKMGSTEVTKQITGQATLVVNTAMATHIGTREYQQDAAYVSEPRYDDGMAFGILCDGMGGMEDGEKVSSDVVAYLANRISRLEAGADIPAFFQQVVVDANEMILERNAQNGQEAGTTLVAVIIQQAGLFWAGVGDSRIYILRDGEIARVTRDHNYALQLQQMVEAGHITQQQADEDPRREALVSYIGAPVLEEVDVSRGSFALETGDLVLLCSDGLTKSLSDERILEVISEHGGDLAETARVLPLAAFDASPGGQDNTSVILMQYHGAAPSTT